MSTLGHDNSRSLSATEFPFPQSDAPQQEKREMYTFFSGHQLCELGHLVSAACLKPYAGAKATPGFAFAMFHPSSMKYCIHLKPSAGVRDAWQALSGYGIQSMLLKKRTDGLYSVVVSGPSPCSGYVAGLLTQNDIDAIVEGLPLPC